MAAAVLSPVSSSIGSSTPTTDSQTLDIAAMTKPTEVSIDDLLSSSDPGFLLLSKICAVLKNIGYDEGTVRKVGGLVVRNLISSSSTQSKSNGEETGIVDIEQVVKGLVGEGKLKVNSNEPVVLVKVGDDAGDALMVKAAVLFYLQDMGILPVRVYVGSAEEDSKLLSVTLLNVVNTDIGGPSMVQLLDAAFHDQWTDSLMVKEAWRERDLIWRDESGYKTAAIIPLQTPADDSYEAEARTRTESQTISEAPLYAPASPVLESTTEVEEKESPITKDHPSTNFEAEEPEDAVEETSDESDHHPAWKELAERDATRVPVVHPTFDKERSGRSFLDLVRSQSMTLESKKEAEEAEGTSAEPAVEPLGEPLGEPLSRQPPTPSPPKSAKEEEDFELV